MESHGASSSLCPTVPFKKKYYCGNEARAWFARLAASLFRSLDSTLVLFSALSLFLFSLLSATGCVSLCAFLFPFLNICLLPITGWVIVDWAMPLLPLYHAETTEQFYGKGGIQYFVFYAIVAVAGSARVMVVQESVPVDLVFGKKVSAPPPASSIPAVWLN
jgi:hypothetical protein